MSIDDDLEKLKAKRLEEMRYNIEQKERISKESKEKPTSPRDILVSCLGYRGLEVLENAERQYPRQVPYIINKLAELMLSGEINERVDGGELLALFRAVGINVHMKTTINVEKNGKFVSISDKIKSSEEK